MRLDRERGKRVWGVASCTTLDLPSLGKALWPVPSNACNSTHQDALLSLRSLAGASRHVAGGV